MAHSVTAPPVFEVQLTAHEIRAVASAASLFGAFIADVGRVAPPAGHSIPPLESAQLKLEMALVLAGEQR